MAQEVVSKTESAENRLDGRDLEVIENRQALQARGKVRALLDTFESQKLATRETVRQYREAALADNTSQGLEGFYEWISQKHDEASERLTGLHDAITDAVRKGFAGENDRDFLMDHLILTDDQDFIGTSEKITKIVAEKLDRMQKDREAYDAVAQHRLVRNTGFLQADENTKIAIPDAKKFLEMAVPERRKLLESAKDALPKAEAYAKKIEAKEDTDLVKDYDKTLKKAQGEEKIIGAATAAKFREGFSVVDRKEKQRWIKEFDAQMGRYRDLWKDIRGTLTGKSLDAAESKRDTLGWSQLSAEFGRIMEGDYDKELDGLREKKIISAHTHAAFSKAMKAQDLAGKKDYRKGLSAEMERYQALRSQIDALDEPKIQKELNGMYDRSDCGYTEINERFQTLTGQATEAAPDDLDGKMRELSHLRRDRVRKNVAQSEGLLDTDDRKLKMVRRLDHLLESENAATYDQSGYADNVQRLRRERQVKTGGPAEAGRAEPARPMSADSVPASAEKTPSLLKRFFSFGKKQAASPEGTAVPEAKASRSQAEDAAFARSLEQAQAAGVHTVRKADDAFQMTRVSVGSQEKRTMQVRIGNRQAMDAFLNEDAQIGPRDSLHLMAQDGEIDRLNLQEVRYFRDYLKTKLKTAA